MCQMFLTQVGEHSIGNTLFDNCTRINGQDYAFLEKYPRV
jgi:hypothetical protein